MRAYQLHGISELSLSDVRDPDHSLSTTILPGGGRLFASFGPCFVG